jgi:D-glycero-alpha-D-manno-heptose-7-phosphate kinase
VRISFAGGGTDLPAYYQQFGGAVLSTAINKYFYTILGKRSDGRVQIISSDLRIFETWADIAAMDSADSRLEIPVATLKELGCELSVDLFLASEIPPGTGLGSSASVCVNLLKTLTTYLRIPVSKYELAERAFHIARDRLGHHLGKQDEYASAFGGLNFFEFQRDGTVRVSPLAMDGQMLSELQNSLMLFFTGSAHNSWQILEEQESSTRTRSGPTIDALHEVRATAEEMRNALRAGDLKSFGRLLHRGWLAKKQISTRISNTRIDKLYDLALQSGALGGKITGAGGGGFLLICCEPEHQNGVRDALDREGVRQMSFGFDFQGAQLIVNDPFIDGDEQSAARWTFLPTSSLV